MGALNEINPRRMRYFHEVLASKSIRVAADKLNIAPSVITRQVKLLEEELAITLFERRTRGVVPTEAAGILLEYYQGCCSQQELLIARLQALRGLQSGNVAIFVTEVFVDALMDEVLNNFCRQYPRLSISVTQASTSEVVTAVVEDVAHIGLVFNPPLDPAIRCRVGVTRPVCLLVSRNHPLASERVPITLADAMRYPIGLMPESFSLRRIIEMLEISEKLRITPVLTTNSVSALKRFVQGGHGVTFMPAFATSCEIESGELVALDIANPLLASTEVRAIVRLGRPLSAACNKLLTQIVANLSIFAR